MNIDDLNQYITSLKETSNDNHNGKDNNYMTESEINVINFDKVKEEYIKNLGVSKPPYSNDALFFDRKSGDYYFIEFKAGGIDPMKNVEIKFKIYDSLLIVLDILKKSIIFSREKMIYILVYNGDFTFNNRTGDVSRMKGGGHGQDNLDFLDANGMEYNIEYTYSNGVRIGNVPMYKTPSKRIGMGQSWFPEAWNNEDIRKAGEYVGSLPDNVSLPDGIIGFGEYEGVRVGVIKTNGKISTVFPDADLQP